MHLPFRKKLLFSLISTIAIFTSLLLVTELFLRIYVSITRGELALIPDQELGWAIKPKFRSERTISNYGGAKTYKIKITTDEHGFRTWSDTASKKTKIFIVGDSFTHSMYASDTGTWYSIFGERTGTEIFAYGCSGYGTIQQYLVVKRFLEKIKPDKVIMAFTSNDFGNNSDTGDYDPIENAFGRPYFVENKQRGQKTEDRRQRTIISGPWSVSGGQKTENNVSGVVAGEDRRSVVGGQSSDYGQQKAEDRGQRAEGGYQQRPVISDQLSENQIPTTDYQTPITDHQPLAYAEIPAIKLKGSSIKRFLCANSHLAYFITTRTRELGRKRSVASDPNEIEDRRRKSLATTKTALLAIRKLLPEKTELLVFALSCEGQELEDLRQICSELEIKCIYGIDEKINEADRDRKLMRAADGSHLNEDGERLVGEWLAEWYRSQ